MGCARGSAPGEPVGRADQLIDDPRLVGRVPGVGDRDELRSAADAAQRVVGVEVVRDATDFAALTVDAPHLAAVFPTVEKLQKEGEEGRKKISQYTRYGTVVIGALLMTLGHASMAIETPTFLYIGITFLILGNGFFKPNMTSIISKMYEEADYELPFHSLHSK